MEIQNTDNFVDLLYRPMTDEIIIKTLNTLGLDQPIVDEKYQENRYVTVDNGDVFFMFRELLEEENSSVGILSTTGISIKQTSDLRLPMNIHFDDSYAELVKKLVQRLHI